MAISAAQTIETHSFTNLNRLVPDGNAAGLSDTRSVTSTVATISTLRVKLNLSGEFNGDLYGYVRHIQGGTTNFCVLLNRVGRSASNPAGYPDAGFNITLADSGASGDVHTYRTVTTPTPASQLTGTWQPDGRTADPGLVLNTSPRTTTLGSFIGTAPSGEWTLYLADIESGGTNLLKGWELEIMGAAKPAVTWPAPTDIAYGTALGLSQLNASSPVAGAFTYSPPSGSILNAGNAQTLTAIFTPLDTANYVKVTNTVSINVLKTTLTVTAQNTNKVYGGPLPALRASYAGFVNGDTTNQLTTQASFNTTATPASAAGSYPITVSGATSPNYAISFVPGNLSVTPASLTIAAVSTNKVYGAAVPGLRASYSGFVNSDTTNQLTTQTLLNTTATPGSAVGNYPITASGATSPNYAISFVPGNLSVTTAPLTIAAVSTNKVYGAPIPTLHASYSGFVNGDTTNQLTTQALLNTTATPASSVGSYPISVGGASSPNYAIAFVSGQLTITKAGIAGLVSSSKNPSLPGEGVTFSLSTTAVAPGAGTPTGTVQFKIDGANFGSPLALIGGTAAFLTALSGGNHSVAAEYPGDSNFHGTTNTLNPVQLVNTPPAPGTDIMEHSPTNGSKILVASLLGNDVDADGDAITFVSFSATSTNGGTVTRNGDWIFYAPVAGFTNEDAFAYTVADVHGATSSGLVQVIIKNDAVPSPNLLIVNLGGGNYLIRFDGIPGKTYRVEFNENVEDPEWQTLTNGTSNGSGLFQIIDSPPNGSPQRYYRSVYP